MDIFSQPITIYSDIYDITGRRGTVGQFLNDTSRIDKIRQLRAARDQETRKRIKKSLPQATISGVFNAPRHTSTLVQHSGLICIDIDRKDNMNVPRFAYLKTEVLAGMSEVAYAALSVGGKGYFVIIPIKYPHKHREHFLQLQRDFKARGITIDRACADVTRLRTMSYDPDPVVNSDASVYSGLYEEPAQQQLQRRRMTAAHDDGETWNKVVACVNMIAANRIDITQGYTNWFRIGAALSTLGEKGRDLFHTVSSFNEQYKYSETNRMFTSLVSRQLRITISTFFYYCTQYGINPNSRK